MHRSDKRVVASPSPAPFADWAIRAADGDQGLADVLMGCLSRFRQRHACLFIDEPGPGFRAMVRVFRGVAVLFDAGLVRSAELFRIPDIGDFFADPGERSATLAATSWDDRAAIFAPRQPPRRTREAPPLLDWSGAACVLTLPDQVRQFEYLLNADLHRDPRADLILEKVRPTDLGGRTIAPHRPLLPDLRESFMELLRPLVAAEAAESLEAFRGRLDPDRLASLAKAGANGVAAYNWLSGLDRRSCDEKLAMRRTQAVTAYPIAWSLLSAPFGDVPEAVREARPLAPALAHALGVPEGTLRRLNGLGIEEAGLAEAADADRAAAVARRAARMPPGQPPRGTAGWRAFFSALALSDAVDRHRATAPDGSPLGVALLASAAGKWDSLDAESMAQAAAGFDDMLQDFHANVAEPIARRLGIQGWTAARTLERIAGNRSLQQMATASAWWHEQQVALRTHLSTLFPLPGEQQGVRSWPPLHAGGESWLATNGLVVVPLTDEDMLVAEHRVMGHCINTYAPSALYRGSHLLSVRTADGSETLGTVEIRQDDVLRIAKTRAEPPDAPLMQLPPSVVQFKSAGNKVPRIEGWEALWEYVSAIMTGALEIDGDFLREDLERRQRTGRSDVRLSTCYDDSTEEAVLEAWKCYSPMLPKSVAKRGPASLVTAAPPRSRSAEPVGPAPGLGA